MGCSPVERFSADDIDTALTGISPLYDPNGRIYSLIYPNSRNQLFADIQHIDGDMCVDEYWLDDAGMQRILVRYPVLYSGNPENLCVFDLCSYVRLQQARIRSARLALRSAELYTGGEEA